MQDKRIETIQQAEMEGLTTPVIAIYDHPDDYRDYYVARIFDAGKPTNVIMLADTREELETDIQEYTDMLFLAPGADDDPKLIGVWG